MRATAVLLVLGLVASVWAEETAAATNDKSSEVKGNDKNSKRQIDAEVVIDAPHHFVYRARAASRNNRVVPVQEPQNEERSDNAGSQRHGAYRPGQVFSLSGQELLNLQPERKATGQGPQHLQQLYQDPYDYSQQIITADLQGHQVQLQPSHAVIARPSQSASGGEASVGAALSVSDSNPVNFDRELLSLLAHPSRIDEQRQQYATSPKTPAPSPATQYQQIDIFAAKSPKHKLTKARAKLQSTQQPPQQYLIETTNVQPQQQRLASTPSPQTLRYVTLQPTYYQASSQSQGLKIVAPPSLQEIQQSRPQVAYRLLTQPQQQIEQKQFKVQEQPEQKQYRYLHEPLHPEQRQYQIFPVDQIQKQYQHMQPEINPRQYQYIQALQSDSGVQNSYRIVQDLKRLEQPRLRPEKSKQVAPVERPVAYFKRYQIPEKPQQEYVQQPQYVPQLSQSIGDQYYIRPIYRQAETKGRYELSHLNVGTMDDARAAEQPKSSIYVSKNTTPKKVASRPASLDSNAVSVVNPPTLSQPVRIEQNGESLEDQRAQLPPPKNNKAYTPEEFAALVAAGYSVTPVPVGSLDVAPAAQARSLQELTARRPYGLRAKPYVPIRGEDAP